MAAKNRTKSRAKSRAARPAKKSKTRTAAAVGKAAPLLASVPKRVGKVVGKVTSKAKSGSAVKPNAPYQPKTGGASSTVAAPKISAATAPEIDPLASARPWMKLGAEMAMSQLTLQARVMKAAMDMPPAAVAMRQASTMYSAWFAMLSGARPIRG